MKAEVLQYGLWLFTLWVFFEIGYYRGHTAFKRALWGEYKNRPTMGQTGGETR